MDWIGSAWSWLLAVQADAWTATAGWATALIAIVTVVVAGKYASGQVSEARKTREEQAQPNVVVFMESNAAVWMQVELVVKNFGATPAYNVKMNFSPDLDCAPRPDRSDNKLPYPPLIPILVPGQEWRTSWDFGPTRLKAEGMPMQYEAKVEYADSKDRQFETKSVLDWDPYTKTRRMTVRTVHDLYAVLKKQNEEIAEIRTQIQRFGNEHQGIWVYGGDADVEHGFRAAAWEEELKTLDEFDRQIFGPASPQPESNPPSDDQTEELRSTVAPEPG